MNHSRKRALVCRCTAGRPAGNPLPAAEALAAAGWMVDIIDDACALRLEGMPAYDRIVVACHRRAAQALFGTDDTRLLAAEDLPPSADPGRATPQADQRTAAWYPVIDQTRCDACGACLDFCLFGVFEAGDDGPLVIRPEACKPDCPACARVCPQGAIIFPKHPQPPINGGEDRVEQPGDLRDLLSDDLHAMLRRRSGGHRFALDRDADEERGLRQARLMAFRHPQSGGTQTNPGG